jgi:hypothetical protein
LIAIQKPKQQESKSKKKDQLQTGQQCLFHINRYLNLAIDSTQIANIME